MALTGVRSRNTRKFSPDRKLRPDAPEIGTGTLYEAKDIFSSRIPRVEDARSAVCAMESCFRRPASCGNYQTATQFTLGVRIGNSIKSLRMLLLPVIACHRSAEWSG